MTVTRRRDLSPGLIVAIVVATSLALIGLLFFVWYFLLPQVVTPNWSAISTSEVNWMPESSALSARWNDPSKRFYSSILLPTGEFCDVDGSCIAIGEPEMVLAIMVPKNPNQKGVDGQPVPAMRLELTSLIRSENGIVLSQPYGIPPVRCDLNAQETAFAWANGIPQSLIDEMIQIAKAAGWKPLPPKGVAKYPAGETIVSTGSHFSKSQGKATSESK